MKRIEQSMEIIFLSKNDLRFTEKIVWVDIFLKDGVNYFKY